MRRPPDTADSDASARAARPSRLHPRGGPLALLAALVVATVAPAAAAAQEQPARPGAGGRPLARRAGGALGDSVQLVDRVAAVVADTAILVSDLREEIFRMQQQGFQLPQSPARLDSLMRETLQRLIDRTLLLQRAQQRGVSVREEDVQVRTDERFKQIRGNFPSDEAFRNAVERTGQNMFQYRQALSAQVRQEMVLNRFRQQLVTNSELPAASVSEEEIRRYFEQNAAQRSRPATVTLQRVMLAPTPTEAARDSARRIARKALEEIRGGTEFAVAARRYSDDPGSRDGGGDLGWLRRGDVVPAFADAAWSAPPGRAVGPVETRYGYHVIKVTNTRGSERQIRHILIRPRISEEDVEAARQLARSLADSLREGASADRLAREHGLPDERVRFEDLEMNSVADRLGIAYADALGTPTAGEVVGPIRLEGAFDLPNFAVVRVAEYRPPGKYRLEDVHNQIRQNLLRQKQFDKYVQRLHSQMYVQVRI